MKTLFFALAGILLFAEITAAQSIQWEGRTLNLSNVKASLVDLNGEQVLKVERNLDALPFDVNNLGKTVDEPTFVTLKDLDISNGAIEVKVLSRIQVPSPFAQAQGFIGLAFRVNGNTAFECIYLRPKVGRSENQFARNHTVQYFAYPDFKFDRLRKESKGEYETYADIGLDEWITMRIEFQGKRAVLYLNDQQHPSFIVNEMKGDSQSGTIGLWVDIGTEGYFKDLKILQTNKSKPEQTPAPQSSTTSRTNAEQEIINLSKDKWQWMSEKNVEVLANLFHEKAVFVHMGGSWGTERELDIIKSGGIWYKKADIHEVSVNIIGTTAILLNRITLLAVVGGNEVTNPFMVTEVYVQQSGTWKLGSLSFTRLLGQ